MNRTIKLTFILIISLLILICSKYMAPKYVMFGQFSIKSDAFSFGVLILEIVSGQKITSFRNGENVKYLLNYVSMLINGKKCIGIYFLSFFWKHVLLTLMYFYRHGKIGEREQFLIS